LAKLEGLAGVSHIAVHSITVRDKKPIKQRYFPKNPVMQWIIVLVGKKSEETRLRRLSTSEGYSIPDA